jgi:hypothetical protein
LVLKRATREQFQWIDNKLVHNQTGAQFSWSYPKQPLSTDMRINWKNAGNVLPNGDHYDREDIRRVALELLSEKR